MTTSDWIRGAVAWLATYGLHSTLFLGGAWLLCALRPPAVNRNRERVWKLALVGGILSTTLQLALGAEPLLGRVDWSARAPLASVPPETRALPAAPTASRPAGEPVVRRSPATRPPPPLPAANSTPLATPAGASRRVQPRPLAEPPATVSTSAAGPADEHAPLERAPGAPTPAHARPRGDEGTSGVALAPLVEALRTRWPGWILAGWTAVGLLGLGAFACSWACLRHHLLGRKLLRTGPLVETLERLRVQSGFATRVRLSVSPRIATPFSTGFWRPEVCLPAAVLTDLTGAQREALLAHELAHLVRRDPAWFGLTFLIEKLLFFQPLNRLARRRLAELAEVACDDWAVRWTGARLALASCLTEVAGWVVGERPRLVAPPGLAGHRSRLGQRVVRLLDDRRSPAGEPPAPWWPPLAAGSLALATLAVPGVSAAAAPSPAPVQEAAGDAARALPESPAEAARARREPPASTPRSPSASVDDMALERGVLESELALLEAELAALHAELEARELRARFAAALERIDARVTELRRQHERVRALLARLAGPEPPAEAPSAAAPAPTSNPRDLR